MLNDFKLKKNYENQLSKNIVHSKYKKKCVQKMQSPLKCKLLLALERDKYVYYGFEKWNLLKKAVSKEPV